MIISIIFWISIAFLVYVYLGYPVLVACLALLRPKEEYPCDNLPSATLIIAAYNEENIIQDKLENVLKLNYPQGKLQIIIAADGSDDKTKEIVESFAKDGIILSYSPERRGKMAAIIHALEKAKGEILVFSDANNFFTSYAIKYLLQPFSNPEVGGTTGAKHIRKEGDSLSSSEGLYWKYESWIKRSESRLNTCTAAAGEILAVRRQLFPHNLPNVVNDDFYILLKIIKDDYRVVYVPQAESWERVSQSARDEVKRRARITAGRFQALAYSVQWLPWNNAAAVWQIFSHKYFRLFIPFAMLFALLMNVPLAINRPLSAAKGNVYVWLMTGQIVFYVLAGLGRKFDFTGSLKVFYLPAFLVSSNLATLKGFFRHLEHTQDTRWEKVNRR